MKINIRNISVEITRRCNLKCAHCCRGNAENIDIDYKYIDSLLDQVEYIHFLTFTGGEPSLNSPAIQYFVNECKRRNVKLDYVVIFTNGINIKQDFIDVCLDTWNFVNKGMSVYLSDDIYHTTQKKYDDSLLKSLSFYKKQSNYKDSDHPLTEGRGQFLKESKYYGAKAAKFTSINDFDSDNHYITLNVYGKIINGIDFSYENQKIHKLCNVKKLTMFYNSLDEKTKSEIIPMVIDSWNVPLVDILK